MRSLIERQRWQAIGMLQTGCTQAQADLNVSQSIVCWLSSLYRTTGDVINIQRSGRPRFTDVRNNHYVINQAFRNRVLTATDLQKRLRHVRGVNVSRQKIKIAFTQRVLTLGALKWSCHCQQCIVMNVWRGVEGGVGCNINQCSHAMFRDKSRFNLDFCDCRRKVFRRQGERFTDAARFSHDWHHIGVGPLWYGWHHYKCMCAMAVWLASTTPTTCWFHMLSRLLNVMAQNSSLTMITLGLIGQDLSVSSWKSNISVYHSQRWASPTLSPIEHV